MSARDFAEGMASLVVNDAIFAGAIVALLGQSVSNVLTSNIPIEQIPSGQWPCWAFEQGDGQNTDLGEGGPSVTLGNGEQHFEQDLYAALIWKDQDRERAARARQDLPKLFAQLLLRNPTPGGIFSAWLDSWAPDRAATHPSHIWVATVRGQYITQRS